MKNKWLFLRKYCCLNLVLLTEGSLLLFRAITHIASSPKTLTSTWAVFLVLAATVIREREMMSSGGRADSSSDHKNSKNLFASKHWRDNFLSLPRDKEIPFSNRFQEYSQGKDFFFSTFWKQQLELQLILNVSFHFSITPKIISTKNN